MKKKSPFRLSKSGLLGVCVAGVMAGQLNPAYAQESEELILEEIIVQGFRESLMKARDLKRDAIGSRDSIVAEDIADFPDLNLAESLQRIPGITITREGGEGRQISLRGLGPDFTTVELNGMQVLGNTSSPMDSRGAVSRTRAFDFNIFASELFNRIDVHKSYSADLDEGGIGGTVGLYTAKPFDQEGFHGAITGQLGDNELTDDKSPRIAGLISNTWGDTFGALASIAYSKRDTVERGYNTFRWRQRTRSNGDPLTTADDQYSTSLDPTTQQLLEDGDLWFARGNRYTVWENEQERLGITSAFQFRPNANLSFGLDALYSKLENNRKEWHLPTSGSSSTALGFVDALEYEERKGDLHVIYGEFSDVTLRTESRVDEADTTFYQLVFTTDWQVNDRTNVSALIGTESSEFDQPVSDKLYFETSGRSITTDFRSDRFYAKNTYDFDTTDPNNWTVRELDLREDEITSEFDTVEVDVDYELNEMSSLQFGLSYKVFNNEGYSRRDDNYVRSQSTPLNDGVTTIGDYAFVYTSHPDANWLAGNVAAAQAFYGIDANLGPDNNRDGSVFDVEEETMAAYIQYEWETELVGKPLRGNIGFRYYDTEITSKGELNGNLGDASVTQSYDGVLPALNLAMDLTDEWVVRFSYSENVTRPALSALSVAGNVDTDTSSNPDPRINAGNPALEPFDSKNYDASIEWYFDEVGYVSVALFYKDIENFVVTESFLVPYGSTGFPLSLLEPGQDANTNFQYTTFVNSDESSFEGYELQFQRDLDFLPSPFDKLGVIANYTYVDGETEYRNVQNSGENVKKPFPGLSERTYNFTLYYEAEEWGARVATAYRDEYISRVEGGLSDEDERGFHNTTYVDFSSFYHVNDNLKLTLEAINLTDEREEQYSDSSDRVYNTTNSGTTFYVGFNYKF